MIATDHAGYSDAVFGLFKILGYRFVPRFRDMTDQRFWCAELPDGQTSHYGPLEPIARNRINLVKIENQWPDMLRVAGSLVTNQVRAYDLMRMFGRVGIRPRWVRPSPNTGASTRQCTCLAWLTGRRHLPATDEPPAHCARVPSPPGPGDLPRPTRPDPPGIPRGTRGSAGLSGPGAQRGDPVDDPLPGRRGHPAARPGRRGARRGRRAIVPAKAKKVNVLGRYAIVASQPTKGLRPLLDPTNPGDQDVLD